MKVVKLTLSDRIGLKIYDLAALVTGRKKAMVETVLYPRDISDRIGHDAWVESGIGHRPMLKSSADGNWYTVSEDSRDLMRADDELYLKLDYIDYVKRQLSQVNVLNDCSSLDLSESVGNPDVDEITVFSAVRPNDGFLGRMVELGYGFEVLDAGSEGDGIVVTKLRRTGCSSN